MGGSSDLDLYETCKREDRVLITLDRDFGEVLRFPPEDMRGIVVLDCRGRLSPAAILARLRELVTFAAARTIDRELWIVEPGRVRIHERRQSL
jgi:predicted nuclease of predicted toxin-antitoxin system